MKKKLTAALIPVGIVVILLSAFFFITGGRCGDVSLSGFTVTDDGSVMVLEAGVATSAGYLRAVSTKSDGNVLYVTFYRTFGINNSIGSRHLFPIELPEECTEIHIWRYEKGFVKTLEKNEDGTWSSTESR